MSDNSIELTYRPDGQALRALTGNAYPSVSRTIRFLELHTGATRFERLANGVQFRIPTNATTARAVHITMNDPDSYTIEFGTIRHNTFTPHPTLTHTDVTLQRLGPVFESVTGLTAYPNQEGTH
ncbi:MULTISPECIES: hypothetical protein [unclassified Nocardia]|uniref:hypothetical protein n=1 Tax=unclassified Nocardia TaxID=2637762 RepID=UPI00278BE2BB|nr:MULTISPECIES: hypothetical protein [unclassified Nocardia]